MFFRTLPGKLSARRILAAVTQQMAGCGIRAPALLERYFAVNSDRAVTLGALHSAPFTTGEVTHDLHRLDCQLIEIVDDDICPTALYQGAAVLETRAHRRMGAKPPMQFFQ